ASRRRHTRSKRDWSSDVCSSDLVAAWTQAEVTEEAIGTRTAHGKKLRRVMREAGKRLRTGDDGTGASETGAGDRPPGTQRDVADTDSPRTHSDGPKEDR